MLPWKYSVHILSSDELFQASISSRTFYKIWFLTDEEMEEYPKYEFSC